MDTSAPAPSRGSDLAAQESSSGSDSEATVLALLLLISLLAVVLLVGRALSRAKFQWLGEAGAALLIGLLVGLFIHLGHPQHAFSQKIVFSNFIFLNVMLPAIIFDAGYSMDPKPLIRNIGSVCMFAFLGTTISTFIIGLMLWGLGVAGVCTELALIYNLLFGAIISATDPVTVLAVFSRLGAQEDLYINVFAESALNDAVALVLYDTLNGFVGETITAGNVFKGIGMFVGIFLGSVALGMVVGLVAAFLFRTGWVRDHEEPEVETGLVVLTGFLSYLAAEAGQMSGIVSVLFCGLVMRSYVTPNLSPSSQLQVASTLRTMASLFELFLFLYIGLTLFLVDEVFNIWAYAAFTLLALAVSRAANILPCAALVNWLRQPHDRIPVKQQFMMWWSGLRGAMAFALALDAADQYGYAGRVMKTCTFYVVLVTVVVNGGSCSYLLTRLGLLKDSGRPIDKDEESPHSTDPLTAGNSLGPNELQLADHTNGNGDRGYGDGDSMFRRDLQELQGGVLPYHHHLGHGQVFATAGIQRAMSEQHKQPAHLSVAQPKSVGPVQLRHAASGHPGAGGVHNAGNHSPDPRLQSEWPTGSPQHLQEQQSPEQRHESGQLDSRSRRSLGRRSALQSVRDFNSGGMERQLARLTRRLDRTFRVRDGNPSADDDATTAVGAAAEHVNEGDGGGAFGDAVLTLHETEQSNNPQIGTSTNGHEAGRG